jgi:hypothetical protein
MGCLICGKLPVSEGTLNQITNIKEKVQNLEEKINSAFTSDPNLSLKLIIKSKNYEKELKQLETGSYASKRLICDDCYKKIKRSMEENITNNNDNSEGSKVSEMLKIVKIYNFMIKEIASDFYLNNEHPIYESTPIEDLESIDFMKDSMDKYNDSIERIQKRFIDCDFYEAYLCYNLGYYNEALVLFEKTLKELEEDNIRGLDNIIKDLGEEFEDYSDGKNKLKNNIQETIYEIKERLGL